MSEEIAVKRCPRCNALSFQFDPYFGRRRCFGACGYTEDARKSGTMRNGGERMTKYYVKEKYESEAKPTNCRTLAAAKREASKAQQFLETTIIVEDENGEVVACKSPDDHWVDVKVTKYQVVWRKEEA